MMILDLLKKLLNISLNPEEFIISGKENWKKGLDLREILESIQRHLAALLDGEEIDKESGISHIGHIQCNAMFYNYHKSRQNNGESERN